MCRLNGFLLFFCYQFNNWALHKTLKNQTLISSGETNLDFTCCCFVFLIISQFNIFMNPQKLLKIKLNVMNMMSSLTVLLPAQITRLKYRKDLGGQESKI